MIDHVRGNGALFSYIQRKENRWLLVKGLDKEMETLFIDFLVILHPRSYNITHIKRGKVEILEVKCMLVTAVTCYGRSLS